jgi:hypothetical protein
LELSGVEPGAGDIIYKEINSVVGANVVPNDVIEFVSDEASWTVCRAMFTAVIDWN